MLGTYSIRINGADCGAEALLLAVITSIGGFLFGYDTGQISGMLLFSDFMKRFGQEHDDGTVYWKSIIKSLLVSLMSLGCLVGALSSSYTSDWFGRRKSMSIAVVVFVIGNIIQITAMESWVHMTIGRIIAGLGVGSLSVGVAVFQSETSPREIRGAVVASYQLMISLGILISNIVNYGVREIQESDSSWRVVIGLEMAFSLPLGIGILFVPESPRWLAGRDDWEGARLSLARLRGKKHDLDNAILEEDMQEMKALIDEENKAGQGTWAECFIPNSDIPKLVYRTFLGMAVQFLQQWTGYYGATIFQSAGIDDPIMVQLILGAVNVAMTVPGIYVTERQLAWKLFLTPFADDGISYSFGYVFAGMNFIAALITWFFLYETRTLSLENIDQMYSHPDLKAWNSAKWTPPGYKTRKERDEAYVHHIGNEGKSEKLAQSDSCAE
ncbi:hypothetical protein G7Z17_g3776 [Cylindrodendrum hubeiense]|uniref:Major facilitator superfamily (MFS) profile domain-containing protein n=1 Tax=Cylindrodendrum hubeiense TaxID=595255 RepID=A0A9P5HE05_9HYPO|nr:hypothetical protein G7Z17_g3776 [Cylindrodendrum hubeiense]